MNITALAEEILEACQNGASESDLIAMLSPLAARLAEADALLYAIWNDTEADMSWREYQNQIAAYRRKHGLADSAPAVPEARKGKPFDAFRAECQAYAAASASPMQCPCGVLYLKVEGGYVPVCDCAAKSTVTVDGGASG